MSAYITKEIWSLLWGLTEETFSFLEEMRKTALFKFNWNGRDEWGGRWVPEWIYLLLFKGFSLERSQMFR